MSRSGVSSGRPATSSAMSRWARTSLELRVCTQLEPKPRTSLVFCKLFGGNLLHGPLGLLIAALVESGSPDIFLGLAVFFWVVAFARCHFSVR